MQGWEDGRRKELTGDPYLGKSMLKASWAETCTFCKAVAEPHGMVGREKQGLFLDGILLEKYCTSFTKGHGEVSALGFPGIPRE